MKRVIVLIIVIVIALVGFIYVNNNKNKVLDNDTVEDESVNTDTINNENNSLVLYFSATNNTKKIAEYISEITDADLIEIVPVDKYTDEDLDYNNSNSRANQEQNNDDARPEIEEIDINIDDYDIIYLGYPIWWGDVPKVILTLLDNYDFSGKTIIPFCTSGGSDISTSVNTLKSYNSNINWYDGKRFSSSTTKDEVEAWIKDI